MYLRIIFFYMALMLPMLNASAALKSTEESQAEELIVSLEKKLNRRQFSTIERLAIVSSAFLGRPYFWGPLGEGAEGDFDQYPLYRADLFDCLTFVETVLAVALTDNLESKTGED